jgi:hypothetical protein
MNAGITVRRSTSSAIGIVSDLIHLLLLFFFVFFELTSGLASKTKVSQVQLLFPCSIFSVSLSFHLRSDLWQIGRHFTNARDESNKAHCCDGYQQHVTFIGCIRISTPNTTPVH